MVPSRQPARRRDGRCPSNRVDARAGRVDRRSGRTAGRAIGRGRGARRCRPSRARRARRPAMGGHRRRCDSSSSRRGELRRLPVLVAVTTRPVEPSSPAPLLDCLGELARTPDVVPAVARRAVDGRGLGLAARSRPARLPIPGSAPSSTTAPAAIRSSCASSPRCSAAKGDCRRSRRYGPGRRSLPASRTSYAVARRACRLTPSNSSPPRPWWDTASTSTSLLPSRTSRSIGRSTSSLRRSMPV